MTRSTMGKGRGQFYALRPCEEPNWRGLIPKRRDPVNAFSDIWDMDDYLSFKAEVAERTDNPWLAERITAEVASRPIPEFGDPSEHAEAARSFEKWLPLIMRRVLAHTRFTPYSMKKTSRLGAPWPVVIDDKVPIVRYLWDTLNSEASLLSWLEGKWTTVGVRVQAEKPGKRRLGIYIAPDGSIVEDEITDDNRRVWWGDVQYIASRTRLVFGPPATNHCTQPVDSWIGTGLHHFPLWRHRPFDQVRELIPPGLEAYAAGDVQHYDHQLGAAAYIYSAYVGGLYDVCTRASFDKPYICPAADWKSAWWVYALGLAQLQSGHSMVAQIGKVYAASCSCEIIQPLLGLSDESTVDFVLGGGDTRLTLRNYGDDSLIGGRKSYVDYFFSASEGIFGLRREEPMRFLGFGLDLDRFAFELSPRSYLERTHLPERPMGEPFRPAPFLGWVERRKAYLQLGNKQEMEKIYRIEDELLAGRGIAWTQIEALARADSERLARAPSGAPLSDDVLDKDYLLTPEQKSAHVGYNTIPTEPAREHVLRWIGPNLKEVV